MEAARRRKEFENLPPGVQVKWSSVNQAYIVMWHDQVLRVLNTRAEVEDYLQDLRRKGGSLGASRKRLEDLVWSKTHRDYKSVIGGRRYILHLDPKTGGTVLVPLSSLSDAELRKKLGKKLGEFEGSRRSLTYGQMPSFAEFEKAFDEDEEIESFGGCYPMELKGRASVAAAAADDRPSREVRGRPCYTAKELYAFVKSLAEIWDSNIPDDPDDWTDKLYKQYEDIVEAWDSADPDERYSLKELREEAGSLASDILGTLGFEWV